MTGENTQHLAFNVADALSDTGVFCKIAHDSIKQITKNIGLSLFLKGSCTTSH